ncbi:MAG: hypothetical protein ACPGOV_08855 [Magnetovibrionaceae bacterium]
MAYDLIVEEEGFFIVQTGDVSFDEINEINDQLLAHEKWDTHRYQIWSYLDAWAIEGEAKDSRVISKIDNMSLKRTHLEPIKIAFLSRNAKTNEVLNAYIDSVDPKQVQARIFREEGDARGWLGG